MLETKNNLLEQNNTKTLLGIFALFTILHHISVSKISIQVYEDTLVPFRNVGTIFVGFFLFLLGYDAICFLKSEFYLKQFICKRILPLLVTFFICNYAYMIVTQLLGARYTIKELLLSFMGVVLLNDQMWLAVEVIILYLILILLRKVCKNEKRMIILLSICTVVLMSFSLF